MGRGSSRNKNTREERGCQTQELFPVTIFFIWARVCVRVMRGKGVAGNTESGLTKNDKQSKKKWAKRRLAAIVCECVLS